MGFTSHRKLGEKHVAAAELSLLLKTRPSPTQCLLKFKQELSSQWRNLLGSSETGIRWLRSTGQTGIKHFHWCHGDGGSTAACSVAEGKKNCSKGLSSGCPTLEQGGHKAGKWQIGDGGPSQGDRKGATRLLDVSVGV